MRIWKRHRRCVSSEDIPRAPPLLSGRLLWCLAQHLQGFCGPLEPPHLSAFHRTPERTVNWRSWGPSLHEDCGWLGKMGDYKYKTAIPCVHQWKSTNSTNEMSKRRVPHERRRSLHAPLLLRPMVVRRRFAAGVNCSREFALASSFILPN